MADTLCVACGVSNPQPRKFCRNCGAPLAAPPASGPEPGGFVANGTWVRPPEELIRLVSRDDLKSGLFSSGVTVPRGTVGVLVSDGRIVDRLQPGFRTTENLASRFMNLFNNKLENTSLYLIDLRPVLVPLEVEAQSGGTSLLYLVMVDASLPQDDAKLLRLLDRLVRDKQSVTTRDVFNELRPRILAVVEPLVAGTNLDPGQRAALEEKIQGLLRAKVGDEFGFDLSVSISMSASSTTVNVRVGEGATPATKKCVSCAADIESSRKFCGKCGVQQPVMTQPGRQCRKCGSLVAEGRAFCAKCGEVFVPPAADQLPLYTADPEQVEVDVVLRVDGKAEASVVDGLKPLVASAVSQHVRACKYDDLTTASGFAALEQAVRETVAAAARAMGLEVAQITLLDIRSKGKAWLLGARAELERDLAGIQIGREWLANESQRLDLEGLQLDLHLRTFRMQRDHAFSKDADDLADRDRRQALLDSESRLDVADRNRAADRDIALDGAQRRQDRTRQTEDQQDHLTGTAQAQARVEQVAGFDRTNELAQIQHARVRDTEEADHGRAQELVQAGHEMGMERQVAQHDGALAREAMQLGSERIHRDLDDRSHVARGDAETAATVSRTQVDAAAHGARTQADTGAYAFRTQKTAEREDDKATRDIAFEDDARREQLKLEKMQKLTEMDAAIAEGDAARAARAAQQQADNELRAQQAEREAAARLALQQQDHTFKMRQQLEGKTYEQMLAMQAAELAAAAGGAGVAEQIAAMKRAEAEASGGAVATALQKEMYERMLQRDAQNAQSQAEAAQQQQVMAMQVMQMMQNLAAQQMQTLGTVTTAAVGGQRETEAARQAAQSQGVNTAVNFAQQAMGNMAQVAAAGAGASVPFVVAPVQPLVQTAPQPKAVALIPCAACHAPFPADDLCCGDCGARRP